MTLNTKPSFLQFVCLCLFLYISLCFSPSFARSETSRWLADKTLAENLWSEKDCSGTWATLWPWAKAGNQEARFMLLRLMAPPPDMSGIEPPGAAHDYTSDIRDFVVFFAYAAPYKPEETLSESYRSVAKQLFQSTGFSERSGGRDFLTCIESAKPDCHQIAVEAKLIPTFQEYAAEIDALIAAGFDAACKQ